MVLADIMNKNPETVRRTETITEVARLLVEANLTALPVVDEQGKLEGIISEGDLLYKKIRPNAPHYVNVLGASIYYGGIGEYNAQFQKLMASEVAELMSTEVITAKPNTDVEEAVAVMVEKHLKSLPVVDENYRLIGVVNRRDIMRLIAKETAQ